MYTFYEQLRWWLPIISAFGLVIKAYTSTKKGVTEFAERLLDNHLAGIEAATTSTEVLTKKTNELLAGQSGKIDMVQSTLHDQQAKNLQVWAGILESLTILKERTPARRTCMAKRK
jgi:hypothetical protein